MNLMEGATLSQVNDTEPGYVLLHMKQLQQYQTWLFTEKQRQEALSLSSFQVESGVDLNNHLFDSSSSRIAGWLQKNLFTDQTRAFKQKQLFIHGPPNIGKTSLVEQLRSLGVRIYDMPYEGFYDVYHDDAYDLIVLDEFKGQKTVQELNMWLQGSTMNVRRKGLPPLLKKKNMPMMILSNYHPTSCFRNLDEMRLAPLLTRLKVVEANTFITIRISCNSEESDSSESDNTQSDTDPTPIEIDNTDSNPEDHSENSLSVHDALLDFIESDDDI